MKPDYGGAARLYWWIGYFICICAICLTAAEAHLLNIIFVLITGVVYMNTGVAYGAKAWKYNQEGLG